MEISNGVFAVVTVQKVTVGGCVNAVADDVTKILPLVLLRWEIAKKVGYIEPQKFTSC